MAYRGADKKMGLNRKGIFFTMIVIVIISMLVASYSFYSYTKERRTIQKRIETMNNFIVSLEEDIPRKMFISGFRTIFVFNSKIIESGNYIQDVNFGTQEIFINGTYLGQNQPIMIGARLEDLKNDLRNQGSKININVTIRDEKISIYQTDPWNIKLSLTANFSIEDKTNLASWNKTIIAIGEIPIFYFEDPVYLIGSGGLITTKINQTSLTIFTQQSLLNFSQNQEYLNSTNSPSFLDRLEGKLSSKNLYGIESLVNIPRLQTQGITTNQKSIVDYIYFSTNNPSYCHISGQPNWFYLDNSSLSTYQAPCE